MPDKSRRTQSIEKTTMTISTPHVHPRVSVGLPVYNGARYLRDAIDSLLDQTFSNFELIISDNASTDETEQICREYVERDNRVRYERQQSNLGAAANYNRTFELARGEYFKWAAHDDVCRPEFLERCVEELDRPGLVDVAVVHPQAVFIDADGRLIGDDHDDLALDQVDPAARFTRVMSEVRAANAVFGVFRRDLLAGTALIGVYPASDWMLLAEVALHGRIMSVEDRLFERRIHDDASLRAIILRGGGKRDGIAWFGPRYARLKSLVPFDVITSLVLARAVLRAPLSLRQRSAAMWVLPRVYWVRLARFHGGRLKQRLRGTFDPGPAGIPHTSGKQ